MFEQRPKEVSEKAPRSRERNGVERKFVQRSCGGYVSQQQTAGGQWLEQWTKWRDICKARSDTEGEGSAGPLGLYSLQLDEIEFERNELRCRLTKRFEQSDPTYIQKKQSGCVGKILYRVEAARTVMLRTYLYLYFIEKKLRLGGF